MKNMHMMEQDRSMNAPLSEEQLETVSGGVGTQPPQKFQVGDHVKIIGSGVNARITSAYYDYYSQKHTWLYWVQFGSYQEGQWVCGQSSRRAMAEDTLIPGGSQ